MKIKATITATEARGGRLVVSAEGYERRYQLDASKFMFVVDDNQQRRAAFHLGREVTITLEPRRKS